MDRENQVIKLRDERILGFAEYGDPKGKPLFYFHGWPSSRKSGERFDAAGKKLHARIIAIDRPGYGLSDYQKGRNILDWPDDVVALADYLKIKKFAVVGVSGGGPYAAVCAYKIPRRITNIGIVVGLAPVYIPGLLDGAPWMSKFCWSTYARFPLLGEVASWSQYLNARYGLALGLHRFLFGAKSDKQLYYDSRIRNTTIKNYREAFRTGYKGAALDLQLYTHPWGLDVNDIKAKVYLWYGEDDKNVTLAMGKYYATHIPRSVLTVYPNEGHLISITHAEQILKTRIKS